MQLSLPFLRAKGGHFGQVWNKINFTQNRIEIFIWNFYKVAECYKTLLMIQRISFYNIIFGKDINSAIEKYFYKKL